jgi:hypothetical protein
VSARRALALPLRCSQDNPAPIAAGTPSHSRGGGPEINNLPPRNLAFTGRTELLAQLRERLTEATVAAVLPVEAVHGLGGTERMRARQARLVC